MAAIAYCLNSKKKVLHIIKLFCFQVNYTLLKDLLHFLNAVSKREDSNKMSASNLGTIFATHIMCPRKLSPEALHATHQLLGKAVTFMIEHAEELFTIPEQLVLDIENHLNNKPAPMKTPKAKVTS